MPMLDDPPGTGPGPSSSNDSIRLQRPSPAGRKRHGGEVTDNDEGDDDVQSALRRRALPDLSDLISEMEARGALGDVPRDVVVRIQVLLIGVGDRCGVCIGVGKVWGRRHIYMGP